MPYVNTGDNTLRIRDSCNCCWKRSKPLEDDDPVYITRRGNVERLDTTKTSQDIAGSRSVQNVEEIVRKAAENRRLDTLEYIERFREMTNLRYDGGQIDPLTLQKIRHINTKIRELFGANSP